MVQVLGAVTPGFEAVEAAFRTNFAERGEVGAAVHVRVAGEVVVDLWGGQADPVEGRRWQRDTLVNVYSAGKPLLATMVLQLVDVGSIELDEPIASLWPEFAAGGKATATVRHALSHRAGVPAIEPPLSDDDLWHWEAMTAALAATPAVYEPGTRVWYHTNTFGHLVGEILRRATGELPGGRLTPLAASLGADLHIGLDDEDLARCATVLLGDRPLSPPDAEPVPEQAVLDRGYFNPPGYSSFGVVNSRAWRQAQVPAANTPPKAWPPSTTPSSSPAGCSARTSRTRPWACKPRAPVRPSGSGWPSGSVSCPPPPVGAWDRTPARTATSARAGPWVSPTPRRRWPSATS